jgi:hypothetical protein
MIARKGPVEAASKVSEPSKAFPRSSSRPRHVTLRKGIEVRTLGRPPLMLHVCDQSDGRAGS